MTQERFSRARHEPGHIWRDEIAGLAKHAIPEMVTLPSGSFVMGSSESELGADPDEWPQHEVTIDYPFALGKYPVTFEQWDAAVTSGANIYSPDEKGWGRGPLPVAQVSRMDAQAYIEWLNSQLDLTGRSNAYRLPSEAEWEFGCRAGTTTPYYFGTSITEAQANFCYDFHSPESRIAGKKQRATPVGQYPANAFGLYDMHGNIWELCADWWREGYSAPGRPDDGRAWLDNQTGQCVMRGGSWLSTAEKLRSAYRGSAMPTYRNIIIGFRLARTLPNYGNVLPPEI